MSQETHDEDTDRGSVWSVDTRRLTLMAVLAAVYALGSFLPGVPMVGAPGTIDATRSLEVGYGIILGPVYGPITAFLGAIIGKTLKGGGFGIFFTPLAPVSAFIAAVLSRPKFGRTRGWFYAAAISVLLILGWYFTPTGRTVYYFPIWHFLGLVIILLLRSKFVEYLNSEDKRQLTIGVALCSYSATMGGHMLGNLIFIFLTNAPTEIFVGLFFVTPLERITITVLSTVIMTPVIYMVRRVYPELASGI